MPPQPMIPTSIAMAAPFAPSPPASSGVATSWPPAAPRGVCHQAPGILPGWKHGRAPRAGGRTFVHKEEALLGELSGGRDRGADGIFQATAPAGLPIGGLEIDRHHTGIP